MTDEPKKLPLRVRLPYGSFEEFAARYRQHVDRGGIFLATRAPKPVGTALAFEVVLADGARLLRGEGMVEQSAAHGPRPGMLLRFTRLDAASRETLDRLLAAAAPPPPPAAPPPSEPEPTTSSEPPRPPEPRTPLPRLTPAAVQRGHRALADDVVMGIDVGTSACRVALHLDGGPRLLPIPAESGRTELPSVVAFHPDTGALVAGSAARQVGLGGTAWMAFGFKRLLGRRVGSREGQALSARLPYPLAQDEAGEPGVELGGVVRSLPALTARLLEELKVAAHEAVGRPVHRAVLTVPAWYTERQRGALLQAASLAGLEVLRLLGEPSAVALAFGAGRGLARKRVLIHDLGGGSFDAAVVAITGDEVELIGAGGEPLLGGLDFDARVEEALLGLLGPAQARVRAGPGPRERLRQAAEAAKVALSLASEAPVSLPALTVDDEGEPLSLQATVQQAWLQELTQPLLQQAQASTALVLQAAGLSRQNLDEVLLVGGQSRSPLLRARLEEAAGRPARSEGDVLGAVALGAALLGHGLVIRERGSRGLAISELLIAPLGVAVQGGGVRRVLERNTRLPAQKSLTIPLRAGQPVQLAVVQGLSERAAENEYLGTISLEAARDGEASLLFQVSLDGRLTLEAALPDGGRRAVQLATAEASDEARDALFAAAPLPALPGEQKGLLGNLWKLLGVDDERK